MIWGIPVLEVHDPAGDITHLREVLSHGAWEFRTAPYRLHLTIGLYSETFPSQDVVARIGSLFERAGSVDRRAGYIRNVQYG